MGDLAGGDGVQVSDDETGRECVRAGVGAFLRG